MRELSYIEAIREALDQEMARDEKVFVIGEDVGAGHGVYGATNGLYEKYGAKRAIDTPISESAILGAAAGSAQLGLRPVAEVMYMDFMCVCMDTLVNQAAKASYMSGGKTSVPMVLRTVYGTGPCVAAQHSQCLETWFAHVPGLKVVTPSTPYDAKGLLITAIRDNNPVVFCEHKLIYPLTGPVPEESYAIPFGKADIKRAGTDVTLITTGAMVHDALAVAEELAAEGVSVEVIDPRTIQPLDMETILASVKKTHRAVVAHEAVKFCGFGGEIASSIMEEAFDYLDAPVVRIGAKFSPIPYYWEQEKEILPQRSDLIAGIKSIL